MSVSKSANEFAGLKCDFCSKMQVTQRYTCAPFKMGEIAGIAHYSDEAWAACGTCADLVDSDRWEGLILRVVDSLPMKLTRKDKIGYENYLRELYRLLRQAKGQVA